MKKHKTIQECIEHYIRIKAIKSFYPTAIIKNVMDEVRIEDVIKECDQWVKKGKLKRKYEIRCIECFHVINVYNEISEIPEHVECPMCAEEIETDTINPLLLYEIVRELT